MITRPILKYWVELLWAKITSLESSIVTSNAQAFVFRPGAVDHGNVYGTWTSLMVALGRVLDEPKTIWFDDSLAAVTIPVGAYNLGTDVTFRGVVPATPPNSASSNRVDVTCPQGVTFTMVERIAGSIRLIYSGTASLFTVPGDGRFYNVYVEDKCRTLASGAGGSIWKVPAGASFFLFLRDEAVTTVSGGGFTWDVDAGAANAQIEAIGPGVLSGMVPTNSLKGAVGPSYTFIQGNLAPQSGGNLIIPTQPAMPTGVIGVFFLNNLQRGTAVLAAGVSPAIPANLFPLSTIAVSLKTPVGDAATIKYAALGADRTLGAPPAGGTATTGSFVIKALSAAGGGAVNAADGSTVDWQILG